MRNKALFLLSVAAITCHAGPAYAQELADNAPTFSGDIVVTANRREQSLSNVGLSVAVFDNEQLTQRNVTNVADMAKLVPGLSVSASTNGAPVYSLRGVGINESTLGSTSSVAIYQDQVPIALPIQSGGPALDLQRLEVLKGPQGTLYGQNATAGLINFIANKPTDDLSFGGTASYGRFNTASVEGFVSGALSETLKARVALRTIQSGDWQKSLSRPGDTLGEQHRYAGRAIVEWEPSSDFNLRLNLNGWKDKSDTIGLQFIRANPSQPDGAQPELIRAPLNPSKSRIADWDGDESLKNNNYFWQGSATAAWNISDSMTLTSTTAYSKFKADATFDIDGVGTDAVTGRDATFVNQDSNSKSKHFYQEVRIDAALGEANLTVGANYNRDVIDEFFLQRFVNLSNTTFTGVTGGGAIDDQKVRAFAVFANTEIPLSDTLKLNAGIRYAKETRKFYGCTTDVGDGSTTAFFVGVLANLQRQAAGLDPIPAVPGEAGCVTVNADLLPGPARLKLKEDNVPWYVNLNWKPVDDLLLYGRVSRGFKSGNFPAQTAPNNTAYRPVRQEQLTAYEIGVRYTSQLVQAEAAAFIYDYKNKQQRGRIDCFCIFGLVTSQINVPKAQIKGVEGSLSVRPVEGLSLAGSFVYIESEVKRYVGYNSDGAFLDQAGFPLNYTPKWNVNIDANYTMPVSSSLNGFVGANMSYRSKTTGDIAGSSTFDIDSYTLLDAQIGIEASNQRWKAWMFGNNITNKYYWTNVVNTSDTTVRWPGMPVTYGVAVSFKY